ncbi:MAG: hypothetical protein ACJ72N_01170 [Labedaea sp.]
MPGDVRDEVQCQRVIERAVEEFDRIDVPVTTPPTRWHSRTVTSATCSEQYTATVPAEPVDC